MHRTFLFWFSVGCLQLNDACYYVINNKTFYNGTTSITKSGKKCQNWESNRPHVPTYRAQGQMNYCRNPDNDTKLWCYTTDPHTRWEYCDIQQCDDCYYVINSKIFYNGTTSITKSGKKCQNWKSNRPHIPSYRAPGQMNYCRNPDNDTKLWCYTTDPHTRWEYCDIQKCGCGQRPREVHFFRMKRQTAKIVYGQSAEYGMYPWQVGVREVSSYGRNTRHMCGGTILNKYWILSAAHCFKYSNESQITLRIGDHNNTQVDEYEQEFDVDTIYMHEQFNSSTIDYDVALLKIRSDDGKGIRFNDYVQPACLPNMDTPYISGTLCHISGWGQTEHGVSPTVLREAMVPLIDDTRCRSLFQNSSITSRMFCAGYQEGRIDTCQGDSGGPLVCEIDGKYTVLGATSWGFGCGQRRYPGVYTHIRNLLPWITDKLNKYN